MEAVVEACRAFSISHIRFPMEGRIAHGFRPTRTNRLKSRVIGSLAAKSRGMLREHGLRSPEHFIGPRLMERMTAESLAVVIGNLLPGTTELMCHPGEGRGDTPHLRRNSELLALTSDEVRGQITRADVVLSTWRSVATRL
jgi:hypothetical protein